MSGIRIGSPQNIGKLKQENAADGDAADAVKFASKIKEQAKSKQLRLGRKSGPQNAGVKLSERGGDAVNESMHRVVSAAEIDALTAPLFEVMDKLNNPVQIEMLMQNPESKSQLGMQLDAIKDAVGSDTTFDLIANKVPARDLAFLAGLNSLLSKSDTY